MKSNKTKINVNNEHLTFESISNEEHDKLYSEKVQLTAKTMHYDDGNEYWYYDDYDEYDHCLEPEFEYSDLD